jgi:hypothetical protein
MMNCHLDPSDSRKDRTASSVPCSGTMIHARRETRMPVPKERMPIPNDRIVTAAQMSRMIGINIQVFPQAGTYFAQYPVFF